MHGLGNRMMIRVGRPGAVVTLAFGVAVGCGVGSNEGDVERGAENATAVTVSFQDGTSPSASYAGTRDTTLRENAPTTAYGTAPDLRVDGDDPGGSGKDLSSLVAWDVSAIPAGSTVQSAAMTIEILNTSAGPYPIYALLRPFSQSQATWSVAQSGAPWELAGAKGATDRDATALGSVSATALGKYTITFNAAGIARVQAWVNDPSKNFGLIVAGTSPRDGLDFASREATTPAARPALKVTYTPPSTSDAGTNSSTDSGTDSSVDSADTATADTATADTATADSATADSGAVQDSAVDDNSGTEAGTYTSFAVIGDYGYDSVQEADVARLVKSWNPEFIVTVGDNNYRGASAIDSDIGKHYSDFIFPYTGSYGPGATTNRFWPSIGNSDWDINGGNTYLGYFVLPGNERYYDFTRGPVHFFVLDSDTSEPDGTSSSSTQALWLKAKLAASTSRWKVVYFHHPPYSSGYYGSTTRMQWPFAEWGANVVMSGHEHSYERILRNNITYFVVGVSGKDSLRGFGTPTTGSQSRYYADWGAMRVRASSTDMQFEFMNRAGAVIDTHAVK